MIVLDANFVCLLEYHRSCVTRNIVDVTLVMYEIVLRKCNYAFYFLAYYHGASYTIILLHGNVNFTSHHTMLSAAFHMPRLKHKCDFFDNQNVLARVHSIIFKLTQGVAVVSP